MGSAGTWWTQEAFERTVKEDIGSHYRSSEKSREAMYLEAEEAGALSMMYSIFHSQTRACWWEVTSRTGTIEAKTALYGQRVLAVP